MSALVGAIEAGGTKFVCAVASGPDDIREECRFPTTTPSETLGRAIEFFRESGARHGPLAALGVACFGPVDPRQDSPTFGSITSTPKPGWSQTDVAGPLGKALGVPVALDTDVNVAAVGEGRWGAAQGLESFIYLTIGTGIGGGGLINGKLLHGLLHPEMGHIRIPRDPARDPYEGHCPFHGDCLEGLASGPAIAARWGKAAQDLGPDHPAWALEADYLALALVNFICTLSPRRIVMGGGVMDQRHLFPAVRDRVRELLNDYVGAEEVHGGIDSYIVSPGLGAHAGVLGAVALAQSAAN